MEKKKKKKTSEDIVLSNGRVIEHYPLTVNGCTYTMAMHTADGNPLSEGEWIEYRKRVFARAKETMAKAREERRSRNQAAFKADKARRNAALRLWQIDEVQFARLLTEIKAVGLTPEDELGELFIRAESKFAAVIEGLADQSKKSVGCTHEKQHELTTEEQIEAIVGSMECWDPEEVLTWAQDTRREMLRGVSPDVVRSEYENKAKG